MREMNVKAVYQKLVGAKKLSIIRLHLFKTYISEWFAIIKKHKLYKNIKWTEEQQRTFDNFWIQHYGKRISPRWHKLYQSINEVFAVDYYPDVLFSTKLEMRMNPYFLCEHLQSKALPELLLGGDLTDGTAGVRLPHTFAVHVGDYCYEKSRKVCSYESLLASLANIGICVIKPAQGGSSGRAFRVMNISNGIDLRSDVSLRAILDTYQGNFIIQEKLEQCEAVNRLYSGSINSFRVITYICDGEVFHCPLSFRIGSGGGEVDNIHAGGIGIGVTDTGILMENAYKLGYYDRKDVYKVHPDTKIPFNGYVVPYIDRIIKAAHLLHGRLPGIGVISWDFILDKDEQPVVIETNLIGQAVWFTQIVNGCSVFGSNTEKMVKFIKEEEVKI